MRDQRHTEVHVLGYRIERVRQFDHQGEMVVQWYEVLAPESAALIGSFAHRAEAEREIVSRELNALQRPVAA
ncbi:MAG: hypothetical protein ABIR62_16875 [Dokdonella sp.]|uniref:hypothetical protein n=1 Tax=Dokdonella sp. TaxID=2291710 RepID=UPI0032678F7D